MVDTYHVAMVYTEPDSFMYLSYCITDGAGLLFALLYMYTFTYTN